MREPIQLLIEEKVNLIQHHHQMADHCQTTIDTLQALLDRCPDELSPNPKKQSLDILPPKEEKELLRQLKQDGSMSKDGIKTDKQRSDRTLPNHVSNNFVCAYLEISEATYYRHVNKKLLQPVEKIGIRSYFLLDDLIALMRHKERFMHQKGAWTFSKLAKQFQDDGK